MEKATLLWLTLLILLSFLFTIPVQASVKLTLSPTSKTIEAKNTSSQPYERIKWCATGAKLYQFSGSTGRQKWMWAVFDNDNANPSCGYNV